MATQVSSGLIENNAINDAHIANVALTGVTASSGDSSTSLATTAFVAGEINSLIDAAPGALNTLNELAAALGDDANFSTTVTNSIATKLPLAGGTLTGALTSGAHLINASSSAFGASSVQGFNTDFLVDTGQGYSRHNSYHTGGSNHQFLVNATSSTTNTVALVITKDANVGIGTSNPATELEVDGDIGIGRVAGGYTFREVVGGNERASIKSNASNELLFSYGAASEGFRLNNAGNVIINKANFSSLPTGSKLNIFGDGITLRLDGSAGTTKSILFRGTNAANPGEVYADGSLRFRTEDASTRITFHTNSSGSNNERMRIDANGKVGIGTTSAPAGLPLQTKVSSGDNKLRMTTANKDAFILELKDATGDVHLGTNTTAGALVIEDDGDVYVGGKFAVNNAPISGSQVYIKKASAGTNLMRWGEGDGSTQDSYRFRIDQNFDFIANSGSGDTFNLGSSTGNVSIGHGGVPSAKVDIVSTGSATYAGSSAGSNIALKLRNLESGASARTIGIAMVSESNAEVYLNCVTNSINNGGDFVIANRHAGGRSERHRFTSDGRQIRSNASITSNNPGHQMNLGYVPHSAAYGSGTTAGVYLHMKMAQRAGGSSWSGYPTGVNVMGRYEYKGYGYGGGFLHSGMSFYTYSGTTTPYGPYYMNNGAGNGMSAYYSTDGYVVIVVHIVANNYTGGVLYFQSGITHRITDNQITSINYSNSNSGVF